MNGKFQHTPLPKTSNKLEKTFAAHVTDDRRGFLIYKESHKTLRKGDRKFTKLICKQPLAIWKHFPPYS